MLIMWRGDTNQHVSLTGPNNFFICQVTNEGMDFAPFKSTSPFLITTLPHVLYALRTLTCCLFLVFALPLPPVVLVLQPPLCGTHTHLAFATLPLPIPSVTFLKLTASSRPSAPLAAHPSASDKATVQCALYKFIYLLTYLLSNASTHRFSQSSRITKIHNMGNVNNSVRTVEKL